jgi:hypothetical protein
MSVITIVIAIVVLLIVTGIYFAVRGRTAGGPRLRDLPEESRRRYAEQWRVIETRFIDHPREAVREADQLVVGLLNERGAQLHHDRVMPRHLRDARRLSEGRDGTDTLHRAMQHYQAIIDDACGKDVREAAERGRLEIA